jgi:putative phosphoserine phosphatase/1-acylglycerol-3-phosphate O-acyltransferase
MSPTIAFFDLDNTILVGTSGLMYLRYLLKTPEATFSKKLNATLQAARYRFAMIDYVAVSVKLVDSISNSSEQVAREVYQHFHDEVLTHKIAPAARQRITEHQALGHRVAILSAATQYVVEPVARALGVEDVLCTRLEVKNGLFTGRVIEPACYGAGKVHYARQYAREHGADLSDAYFYSDSDVDLPLLELVGHPVAVNPDRRLAEVARQRGWPIEMFARA